MTAPLWGWGALAGFVLVALAVDLVLFRRTDRPISVKQAAIVSGAWLALGLGFAGVLWGRLGTEKAAQYLAGYLVEYSLSVDNLFVFAVIMTAFAVPLGAQHRVLMVGVVGALIVRAVFILAGTALIARFHWLLYLFGAFLVVTGIRMTRSRAEPEPQRNPVVRLLAARVTPLAAAVIAVAVTDVVFALDSVPVIFGLTLDPFIVFSANAFALLGLRTLYFLLAALLRRFTFLQAGIALLLVLAGTKMLLSDIVHVPIWLALIAIAGILLSAILASHVSARRLSPGRSRLDAPPHRRPAPLR